MTTSPGSGVSWVDSVPWAAVWGATTFGLGILTYILSRRLWALNVRNTNLSERNTELNEANHKLAKDKAAMDERMREPSVKVRLSVQTFRHLRELKVMVTGDGGDVHDVRVSLEYPDPDLKERSYSFETNDDPPKVLSFGQSVLFRMWNEFPHATNFLTKLDPTAFSLKVYSGPREIWAKQDGELSELLVQLIRIDSTLPPAPQTEPERQRFRLGQVWGAVVRG